MEDHFKNQPNPNAMMPPTADERTWGMFSHAGFIIGGILVPLIIYLVKKNESRFVAQNAANALNWMLTLMLILVVMMILMFVVIGIAAATQSAAAMVIVIPFYLIIIGISIYNIVRGIMAMIKANKGEVATYPNSIKFVKYA
jgi:uncharacterized Tic20 family protein